LLRGSTNGVVFTLAGRLPLRAARRLPTPEARYAAPQKRCLKPPAADDAAITPRRDIAPYGNTPAFRLSIAPGTFTARESPTPYDLRQQEAQHTAPLMNFRTPQRSKKACAMRRPRGATAAQAASVPRR
jgi:hypothetical protein